MSDLVGAVVVAGGQGERMNSKLPKQFLDLSGKPVVQWALEKFDTHSLVTHLVLVLPSNWIDEGKRFLASFEPTKIFTITEGGQTRQDSVEAGLRALGHSEGLVLVHDAARPLVETDIITRSIITAKEKRTAVCALKVVDTVVRAKNAIITEQESRQNLYRVQTPQVFYTEDLLRAFENARLKNIVATDDASLIRELGIDINLVEGSECNIKLTSQKDYEFLQKLVLKG